MKCKNCGFEFEDGIFCPECGTHYEDTAGSVEVEAKETNDTSMPPVNEENNDYPILKKWWFWIIAVFILLFLLSQWWFWIIAICGFIYYRIKRKKQ